MTRDDGSRRVPIPAPLEAFLFGRNDSRLRASWRVLLTWGLLLVWSVVATRAGAFTRPYWDTLPAPAQQLLNITVGTAIFLALFVVFARYVDQRSLSNYGFALTPLWVAELAVGFVAVLAGAALWHALGVVLGWTTLRLALGPDVFTTLLWLLVLLVPWYFSGLTQSLLSVALVAKNAAEGLHARGAPLGQAAIGAVVVAILFFVVRHSPTTGTRVLSLVFGGAVFTLLYVHSGRLALSIGALASANYTNRFVFTNTTAGGPVGDGLGVFYLSQSLPETVDVVARTNLPVMLLTYLLAVGWLRWRRRGVTVHPSLTEWHPREDTPRN